MRLACAICISFALAESSFAQSTCTDVLRHAVQDTLKLDAQKTTRQAIKEAFCDKRLELFAKQQSAGFSVAVPFEGVPLEIGADGTSGISEQKLKEFCGSTDAAFSEDQTISILKQVSSRVAEKAIDAWSVCMSGNPSLIQLTRSEDEDALIVTARYLSTEGIQTPIIDTVKWSGPVQCEGLFATGRLVLARGAKELCTRTGDEPVSLVLSTSVGSAELKISRRKKPGSLAGSCQTIRSVEQISYEDKGVCQKGPTVFTENFDGTKKHGYYNVTVTATEGNQLGGECARICVPNHPEGKNGCGHAVWGQESRDSTTVSRLVDVTGPQVALQLGHKLMQRTSQYTEQPSERFDVLYERVFSVEVPKSGYAKLACTISSDQFITALPTPEDNAIVQKHLARVGEQNTPVGYIYTFRVRTTPD